MPFTPLSASTVASPNNRDLQAAINKWKKELSQIIGDEQTVNVCLMSLIIPVASMLGSSGRIPFDREAFQVLKSHPTDDEALYEARVDGLIME